VDDENFRRSHRTYKNETGPNHELPITPDMIFPAVTIRDPFKWMQSVRRHTGLFVMEVLSPCPILNANHCDIYYIFPIVNLISDVPT
jgi:hypothetical protein